MSSAPEIPAAGPQPGESGTANAADMANAADAASAPAPYRPAAPIDCCVLLRAKSMYYRPDERPGRLHPSDVMHYWCERSHMQIGPDEQATHPHACQPGRGCFQRDED